MNLITVNAPNHRVLKIPIVYFPDQNYVIDANLSPFYFDDEDEITDTISVIGDFNNFSKSENVIKMTKLENGIYTAKIPNTKDTIGYQILLIFKIKDYDTYYPLTVNGQQADFYKPTANKFFVDMLDNNLSYISYIVSNEKEIHIEFDPSKITKQQPLASIKSDNKGIEKIFQYQDTLDELMNTYWRRIRTEELSREEYRAMKYGHTKKISSLFANAEEKELKLFFAKNYIEFFAYGRNYSLKEVDTNIINYISTNFPLNFPLLNESDFIYLCGMENYINNEDLLSNKRFQNYLENIDETSDECAWFYKSIVDFYMMGRDTAAARFFYMTLTSKFPPEHATIVSITNQYNFSGNKKIVVGNIIPDFELPNVDNPDEIISMQKLRGKWVLIDVWSKGCAPCLEEIPNMKIVYDKYKSKNFEIYGISFDSPEELKKFKSIPKYKSNWLHSSVGEGGFHSTVAKLLETIGIPYYILVAPDGKIAALTDLRGSSLEETLKELIK
jgi:peroxiredoxin